MTNYYAHSKEDTGPEEWQPLEEHLKQTAEKAAEFARFFGGEKWAYLAGLWHDVGKYTGEFQGKLYRENGIECHLETKQGRVIHSEAGGHLARQKMGEKEARILCWLIMGHHAGLADYNSDKTGDSSLKVKIRRCKEKSKTALEKTPEWIKDRHAPAPPSLLTLQNGRGDVSFFIRMLFSCLVDADFLDTEAFMNKARAVQREQEYPSIKELLSAFDLHMNALCKKAASTPVNKIRAAVLKQCQEKAEKEAGVFSLTVPTGGGKTLSSLAFALRHAVKHGKRRIIYVIPYTSIIEQTANEFRGIEGFENAVLEHHCYVSEEKESKESIHSRLAAENWDMPLVVTTAVQFFESLYACKTSRCRKLHNIVNSVVIFDEAQCIPAKYLRPAVLVIRELNRHYGVTPLLCTATQPVLTQRESFNFKFKEGFESVTEIIDDPDALSRTLQRVNLERYNDLKPASLEKIAQAVCSEEGSVLCIVNRRKDARQLAEYLLEEQTLHLSTHMCAAHRFRVLKQIRKRLISDTEPLYVVSTSLVEAGVDLDFPVVYRALAGLDSLAQAGGRCNREGRLPAGGKTVFFLPEKQPGYVKVPASLAREYLDEGKLKELFQPASFTSYFEKLFYNLGESELDKKGILNKLELTNDFDFYFRTAAQKFRLIEDDWQLPLIVPYGEAPELVDKLLNWNARSLFRKLQRYTVTIPQQTHKQLVEEEHARELLPEYPGTFFLHNELSLYSDRFGFIPPDEIDGYNPETLIK